MPQGVAECGQCVTSHDALDACQAAVTYGYPWSGLIAGFKFAGDAAWARAFATLMRSAPWVEPALEQAAAVLPMPLSPERLAERGFNQAWQLARALAPKTARHDLLLRTKHTPAQASLDLKRRHANVKGAFAVEPLKACELRGKRVVLVDDVMTSGASLMAAAVALRQAGAAHVGAIVFARTDPPR